MGIERVDYGLDSFVRREMPGVALNGKAAAGLVFDGFEMNVGNAHRHIPFTVIRS